MGYLPVFVAVNLTHVGLWNNYSDYTNNDNNHNNNKSNDYNNFNWSEGE